MKLFQDYKKRFNLITFIVLGFVIITPIYFLHAQSAEEINQKISQRNLDIDYLEKEIAQYQNQLDDIGKQKNSLNSSLKELDINSKKLNANIKVTERKIENKNSEIKDLGLQINEKVNTIDNNKNAIALEIKQTNEFENNTILESILSKNKISNIWKDIDTMSTVQNQIREKIIEIKNIKTKLENTKNITEKARSELISLKSDLADQKKIVDQNTKDKKKLLAQTKNNEASYQKLLKDKLAKKEAFENELRNYESQLKFILDPSKLPNGGVLSWPLDKIYMTQLFGKTEAGKRLYANGTHNGVDFRASVGTPVKAMANGTVMGTGDTDLTCSSASFGRFVFIKYDNGLSSTYGHLSLIKVYQGQKVSRGEIVGYSGNTGYSTGPHLHLSLYASNAVKMESRASKTCNGRTYTMPISPVNAYLDPMYYLPPYKQ
ncbi:MAG: peptidoglycan DD-metalloendopeptidase family protein [Candidatus Nomurabacteria bacterium]|nr:peptidoglycan DD-metalloendopeptidase family protein [Candidatus Nomurabacteria bacterium]